MPVELKSEIFACLLLISYSGLPVETMTVINWSTSRSTRQSLRYIWEPRVSWYWNLTCFSGVYEHYEYKFII